MSEIMVQKGLSHKPNEGLGKYLLCIISGLYEKILDINFLCNNYLIMGYLLLFHFVENLKLLPSKMSLFRHTKLYWN